jgi:hypothetical protein
MRQFGAARSAANARGVFQSGFIGAADGHLARIALPCGVLSLSRVRRL